MTEHGRVLVSSPDRARRISVAEALTGFSVITCSDPATTRALATACRPWVVIVDASDEAHTRPTVAGLREDFRTAATALVYMVDEPPVRGMVAGAPGSNDDFVVRPFTREEIRARVAFCIERSRAQKTMNPLTGLPANSAVTEEMTRRLECGVPFELLYLDLDDFKAVNDRLGFIRGDEVIRAAARCIVAALEEAGGGSWFAGHVGGDDFVVLAPPGEARGLAAAVVERFEAGDHGCSMTVGVVESAEGPAADLARRAAFAKAAAKQGRAAARPVHRTRP